MKTKRCFLGSYSLDPRLLGFKAMKFYFCVVSVSKEFCNLLEAGYRVERWLVH